MLSETDKESLFNDNNRQFVVKRDVLCDTGTTALKNVLQFYETHLLEPYLNLFQLAGVGHTTNGIKDSQYRGDFRCWLSPSLCTEHELLGVKSIISKIVSECQGRLSVQHNLNGHYSIQAALYRGNGAHYVRHLDAGPKAEQIKSTILPNSNQEAGACPGRRRLTFIYYLNEATTDSDVDMGGQLRLYNVNSSDASPMHECESYIDIEPTLGTLVVFRSDTVEHEVLPTFRDRWALTLWAYAHDDDKEEDCSARVDVTASDVHSTLPTSTAHRTSLSHTTDSAYPLSSSNRSQQCSQSPRPPALRVPEAEETPENIFVSVISYRDSELPHTVKDLFASATLPCRVYVGIVYQLDRSDEPHCRLHPTQLDCYCSDCGDQTGSGDNHSIESCAGKFYSEHVRTLSLPHTEAKGPIFARHLAASLYGGEQFVLQIDSHMRFRQGWDAYLVHLLRYIETQRGSDKVVLSTYPLGYHLPDLIPLDTRPTVLMPSRFDEHGFLRQEGKILDVVSSEHSATGGSDANNNTVPYFKSALWAAGFSFSRGALLLEVPYSPLLPHLFFGEEVSMAARLHTHGWDLFAPPEAVLYHLYSRQHRPTFQELQNPSTVTNTTKSTSQPRHTVNGVHSDIATLKQRSMRIVQHLLRCGEVTDCSDFAFQNLLSLNQKHNGLGDKRTLESFWTQLELLGVSCPIPHTAPLAGADRVEKGGRTGSVTRNDANRLKFLSPDDRTLHSKYAFVQTGSNNTVSPDATVPVTTPTSAHTSRSQDATRLMALLTGSGVGNHIQGFL